MRLKVTLIVLTMLVLIALGTNVVIGATVDSKTPSVSVIPQVSPMSDTAQIVVMGAGYEPGEELKLLLKTNDGVITDIAGHIAPTPIKANDFGSFVTVWDCGTFVKNKLASEGLYTIFVTDGGYGYNKLVSVPFALVDTSQPVDKWQKWARVALGK